MKLAVVYICVPGVPDLERCANRFQDTYLQFEAGIEHDLFVGIGKAYRTMNKVVVPKKESALIGKLKYTRVFPLISAGMDIGCHQEMAKRPELDPYDFVLFCNSRTFFHRPGWLLRLAEARAEHGEGLYGATGSYEACPLKLTNGPNPHIRTPFYACNPAVYRQYPHLINSRKEAYHAECGDNKISDWFEKQGHAVVMVTFDGCYDKYQWRQPDNCFRKGDQSNLLAFDRHSLLYEQANPRMKNMLRASADGLRIHANENKS